jgi:hypothetical protein
MCSVGDIIVVKNYTHNGASLSRHSFVVVQDQGGQIRGIEFDIICNVISSFKNSDHKTKKMRHPGNFPIVANDCVIKNGHGLDGYIKADQLYYFKKDKLDYFKIGHMDMDIFNLLIEFIQGLDEFEEITDNL